MFSFFFTFTLLFRETVGMKLLRRLGWRPGQGVGPRVSRYQKVAARRERQKIHGPQEPQGTMKCIVMFVCNLLFSV